MSTSFQVKIEKIKECGGPEHTSAAPFVVDDGSPHDLAEGLPQDDTSMHVKGSTGKSDCSLHQLQPPTAIVPPSLHHRQSVLPCHGRNPPEQTQMTIRMSKRTMKPMRKYVRKVRPQVVDLSDSVDIEDPHQSAAFMSHISTLVENIAASVDIRDSSSASAQNVIARNQRRLSQHLLLVTLPCEGVSSSPPDGSASGSGMTTSPAGELPCMSASSGGLGTIAVQDEMKLVASCSRNVHDAAVPGTLKRKSSKKAMNHNIEHDVKDGPPQIPRHPKDFTPPKMRSQNATVSIPGQELRRCFFEMRNQSFSSSSVKLPGKCPSSVVDADFRVHRNGELLYVWTAACAVPSEHIPN
jgi:hypothetical protein